MTEANKKIFLDLIKKVDINELVIPDEAKPFSRRKWFKFGAYDSLRTLSEMVKAQ